MPQQQDGGLIKLLEEMKAKEELHFERLQDWKKAEPENRRVDEFDAVQQLGHRKLFESDRTSEEVCVVSRRKVRARHAYHNEKREAFEQLARQVAAIIGWRRLTRIAMAKLAD